MEMSIGFPPVARGDARLLVLGSLPSERSIQAGQYYAHPQNAFWRIMRDLIGAEGAYDERCKTLMKHRIALWDVLKQSLRPGSMDADIRLETAEVNDFSKFFEAHSDIELVCFNGKKAAQMFQRFVGLDDTVRPRRFESLPSTSPAYASMPYAGKLKRWRKVIA